MSLLSALGAGIGPMALKTGAGAPSTVAPPGYAPPGPRGQGVFGIPGGANAADMVHIAAARQMFPEMTDVNDLIAAGRRLNAGGGQQTPAPTAPVAAPTGFGPTDSRLLRALDPNGG